MKLQRLINKVPVFDDEHPWLYWMVLFPLYAVSGFVGGFLGAMLWHILHP